MRVGVGIRVYLGIYIAYVVCGLCNVRQTQPYQQVQTPMLARTTNGATGRLVSGLCATLLAITTFPSPSLALLEDSEFVSHLNKESYYSSVIDSPLLWVTLWYDETPASASLADHIEEAAESLHKYGIRFAAVDGSENSNFAATNGVQGGLPSLTFCNQPPIQNPYSNSSSRQAAAVNDASLISSSAIIKKLASAQLLDIVNRWVWSG